VRPLRALLGAAFAAALAGLGCREDVTAPGRCPGLCPAAQIRVVDTTLTGIVVSDTSFVGYVGAREAPFVLASSGDSLQAVGLIRFGTRDSTWYPTANDTAVHIGTVDSVRLTLTVTSRDTVARNVWLLVYRLPAFFDTSITRADVLPFLVDSLLVDSIQIPDSLKSGLVSDSIRAGFAALGTIPAADTNVVSLALVAHGSAPVTIALASSEEISGAPRLYWYVHAAAPRDTLKTTLSIGPQFDTFVFRPYATGAATGLVAGGLPSARSLVRFQLPPEAIDSVGLVRATLILTTTGRATGLPDEHFRLSARGIIRDFGAKSVIFTDTAAGGTAPLVTGDSGEVRIEIARMLRLWGTTSGDSLPRALMLMSASEGGGLGGVSVARSTAGAAAPRLRITYVRPYEFGVP
jgi:hypothetical protein